MRKRHAFTLVELLVVIGIIALLISILLPALNKARQAAYSAACLANLRMVGQGLHLYANAYRGAIPGSMAQSGAVYYNQPNMSSPAAYPGVSDLGGVLPEGLPASNDDFIHPLMQAMGTKLTTLNDTSYINRYREYVNLKQFTCPAYNGVLATAFTASGGLDAGVLQAPSYNTATMFLFTSSTPTPGTTGETRLAAVPSSTAWPSVPQGYMPKVAKVGGAAQKIYAADGGKFTNDTTSPSYTLRIWQFATTTNGWSGTWSDFGPWTQQTTSYRRTNAAGNAGGAAIDARAFAFRHGSSPNKKISSGMRMNAVYYDGHAETLEELDACNPALWMPKGGYLPASGYTKVWPDVAAKYAIGGGWVSP